MWPFSKKQSQPKKTHHKYKVVHVEGRGYIPAVHKGSFCGWVHLDKAGNEGNSLDVVIGKYYDTYWMDYHEDKESAISCIEKHKTPIKTDVVYTSN